MPTVCLIINTYNRPKLLKMVMDSVLQQTMKPHSVIVADDGSGRKTEKLVKKYKMLMNDIGLQILNAKQLDNGCRISRARNLALSLCRNSYIIMVDGDIIMDSNFIEDHMSQAKRGQFVVGSKVMLSPSQTDTVLNGTKAPSFSLSRNISAIRSRLLCRFFSFEKKTTRGLTAGNIAFWRTDALKVNGFNNEFVNWGLEDKEFFTRLINNGLTCKRYRFSAIAYHLHHTPRKTPDGALNSKILKTTEDLGLRWCLKGVNEFTDVNNYQPNDLITKLYLSTAEHIARENHVPT